MPSQPRIDLDSNATTPCDRQVVEAMIPWLTERSANPSSPHRAGQEARRAVEEAREEVASLVGAQAAEVVFTSGGTEADNLGVVGLARGVRDRSPERIRILVSAIEHPAVAESVRALAAVGFEIVPMPANRDGVVPVGNPEERFDDRTALVALMAANNETGVIQPWREAAAAARKAGALFLCDAVQAAGKVPVDFGSSAATALVLSAHKIHGPKGVGALVLRAGTEIEPLFRGGMQQKRRRPGTEPVPLLVGFGVAARIARERLDRTTAEVARRRDRLEERLLASLSGAFVTGRGADRVPNTISLTIPGVPAETLLIRLDLEGIAVSTGAACSTGVVRPSPVLVASGLDPKRATETLRLSLSRETTDEEVDRVAELLPFLARRIAEIERG
jgi:cysteine desulfurase